MRNLTSDFMLIKGYINDGNYGGLSKNVSCGFLNWRDGLLVFRDGTFEGKSNDHPRITIRTGLYQETLDRVEEAVVCAGSFIINNLGEVK